MIKDEGGLLTITDKCPSCRKKLSMSFKEISSHIAFLHTKCSISWIAYMNPSCVDVKCFGVE